MRLLHLTVIETEFLRNAAPFGSGVVGAWLGSLTTRKSARVAAAASQLSFESAEAERRQQLQFAREERWAHRQVDLYLRLIDFVFELEEFRKLATRAVMTRRGSTTPGPQATL